MNDKKSEEENSADVPAENENGKRKDKINRIFPYTTLSKRELVKQLAANYDEKKVDIIYELYCKPLTDWIGWRFRFLIEADRDALFNQTFYLCFSKIQAYRPQSDNCSRNRFCNFLVFKSLEAFKELFRELAENRAHESVRYVALAENYPDFNYARLVAEMEGQADHADLLDTKYMTWNAFCESVRQAAREKRGSYGIVRDILKKSATAAGILQEDHADLLNLIFVCEMKHADIAEIIGITAEYSRKLKSRFHQQANESLNETVRKLIEELRLTPEFAELAPIIKKNFQALCGDDLFGGDMILM